MSDQTTPTSAMSKKGAAANFVWGLPDGVNVTTFGRVTSFSDKRGASKEPLHNADGETDGVIYYNHRNDGTLECIIPSSNLGTCEIATSVTIDGRAYFIEEVTKNWTSGAWAKITITLVKHQMIS